MKNQRGVTLVELLVIIVVMGVIFVPISLMLNYSLETEKEVSIKNDVQREARLIMEYVTEKMRDSNIVWNYYGSGSKILKDESNPSSPPLLEYEKNNGSKGIMMKGNAVLSENITEFTVTENGNLITIKLVIEKLDFEFELQSEIIHPDTYRFKYF